MTRKALVFIFLGLPWAFLNCGREAEKEACFDVAVVMDAGGLGDKGKNDMVWRGCQRFAEESGVVAKIQCYEPSTEAEGRANLGEASDAGAEAVVVVSTMWESYVRDLAADYPKVRYFIVGGRGGRPNVKSLGFPAADTGYLMGVAAAAAVPAGDYAFLGGREDRVTKDLAAGYCEGLRDENPSSRVAVAYLGDDFAAPTAYGKAADLAASLFEAGAAVIFAAAGPANAVIAHTAKERKKLVIGYESNQNYLERGYVITSLNIRWDCVVFEELNATAAGKFKGGSREINIASEYICYPIDDNNRSLIPAEAVRKIEAARQRLAARASG